ncbi:radical SAM/SPASM domain-containing protein [Enterococcus faecalis]|uniref:radical SAM/SPASM domain-containing protein n=1 Tax=Enterococcus faecalis TaxID=1351 RepID=UPI000D683CEA|nr:SPASM domain-containing protein [Enterococcus faecalis]PWI82954.1 radical SAM/SPASM domain-containing protein [Enterococcus faecalis]PWI85208.1 radical SAM/SPASM domain-containing protein [Enterococcus faecalis]PWI87918.1 radical SAM/SPASM domain-containing protein [Enterococcus faecalis]
MKHISVLIKPASSLCNLRCSYCFYANISSLREVCSFGKMKEKVTEKMIKNIYADLEDGDQLTLAFQGGEPTMAGLNYFRKVTQLVAQQQKQVQVNYAIQTNGTLINEKWCIFFKKHNFLVGLSIDGHSLYHDLYRVDSKGRGTFQRVLKTKQLFDHFEINYNVLCVLTNPLAKEAKKVFRFLKEQKIDFVQFIPCLDDIDAKERNSYALTPKRFVGFYHQLLQLWLQELAEMHYVSIKLFDDLLNLLVKQQVTACGILGNCQVQYVIEADGSVYPCDFYVLDDYQMGYIQEQTLRQLFEQEIAKTFVCERPEMTKTCVSCPFQKMCRGGCKRMKDAIYVDDTGYCGYKQLLQEFVPQINRILSLLQEISV